MFNIYFFVLQLGLMLKKNIHISAQLEDTHILEPSTRITNTQDLLNLGIKGLKLPRHIIQSAVHNHKHNIQEAAYAVLTTWANQQETVLEAYVNIMAALKNCKMNQLATELRQWVEGVTLTEQISEESMLKDTITNFSPFFSSDISFVKSCHDLQE